MLVLKGCAAVDMTVALECGWGIIFDVDNTVRAGAVIGVV